MDNSDSNDFVRVALYVDEAMASREVILAEPTSADDIFIARNIPAFVYGLALGDHFRLLDADRGDFALVKRSGEVTVRGYVRGTLDRQEVTDIIDELTQKGGQFEIGRNCEADSGHTSLLLLSAHVSLGFPHIESLIKKLPADICDWEYGNIYDGEGVPLNWW